MGKINQTIGWPLILCPQVLRETKMGNICPYKLYGTCDERLHGFKAYRAAFIELSLHNKIKSKQPMSKSQVPPRSWESISLWDT